MISPKSRKSLLLKSVIGIVLSGSLLAAVSGIEAFPFSPYPMYSKLIKKDPYYTNLRLKLINKDGSESLFHNQQFGLFHYDQQLNESLLRNMRAGKDSQALVSSIYKTIQQRTSDEKRNFIGLRLYETQINWEPFKVCILKKEKNCSEYSKDALIAEVKDELSHL